MCPGTKQKCRPSHAETIMNFNRATAEHDSPMGPSRPCSVKLAMHAWQTSPLCGEAENGPWWPQHGWDWQQLCQDLRIMGPELLALESELLDQSEMILP